MRCLPRPSWPQATESRHMSLSDDTFAFGWLHLSDIHFGHGRAGTHIDQGLVLDRLVSDLRALQTRNVPRPQSVLVTGDVAYSGGSKPREYENASSWLGELIAAVD